MAAMDKGLNSDQIGGLFPRLQERYGLKADPLLMERPFYGGCGRAQVLDTVRQLAAFGDLVLVMTGPRGSGKSRMLAEFLGAESRSLDCHVLKSTDLSSEQAAAAALLKNAPPRLGLNQSPAGAIASFFRWSEGAVDRGRRKVIVVDGAEQASTGVLKALIQGFCNADRSCAAVPVLVGGERFPKRLSEAAGIEFMSAVHVSELLPLAKADIQAYLEPRIIAAGGNPSELLNRRFLDQLGRMSQGTFTRLKRVAPAVWLDLAGANSLALHRATISGRASMLGRVAAAVALLLGASWWLINDLYSPDPIETPVERPETAERRSVTLGPENPTAEASGGESTPVGVAERVPEEEVVSEDAELPETLSADGAESVIAGEAQTLDTNLEAPPEEFEEVDGALPESAVPVQSLNQAPEAANLSTESDETEATPAEQAVAASASPAENVEQPTASDLPVPGSGSSTDDGAAQPSEASDAQPASDEASAPPEPPPGFVPARPERFVSLSEVHSKSGLTAQFIAGYSEQTALKFLDRHSGFTGLRYTKSMHKGKDWFVVFYGDFGSREAARSELESLPGRLARADSWIRPSSDL